MNEPLMTVYVDITRSEGLSGDRASVNLLHFHARAEGALFNGETVSDGVDTQIFDDGHFSMSARYLLEGIDSEGNRCRVFIENNGTTLEDCRPKLYSDSKALAYLNGRELTASGETVGDGVVIKIFAPKT